MQTTMRAAATLALFLIGANAASAAQTGPAGSVCPDKQATEVRARIDPLGRVVRCGFGVKIFGIGGGIFGPECPDKKALYPAHQECKGEPLEGHYCRIAGSLPVLIEDCECTKATVFGTGFLLPRCECASAGTAGAIEDFETLACPGS